MVLNNEQLKRIYYGAYSFAETEDGYLQAFQYSKAQMDYFAKASIIWYERCSASAAKTLEFVTEATKISFDYKIIWIGSQDSFELCVDGLITDIVYVKDIKEEGTISFSLEGKKKNVMIYLPADATVVIKNFEINADILPVKKGEKVLWLGDSITQGYGPLRSGNTYVSVANRLLGYDIINQGIGGYIYDKNSLMKMEGYKPDKIIVALGTNQYGTKTMKDIEEYYEVLTEIYKGTPILCITPLWRGDYFGDKERIAEKTSELYKREKYHPMASLIPLAIQLILLMGVIEAVKRGMADPTVDMNFFGINLSYVPIEAKGLFYLSPVFAGLSAWLMCAAQNAANVLQAEQSKLNKYGMLAFSVGLSVYLGLFVSVGVALYWVASNLMAILQLYLLNWAINPKDYVDYERLEESKQKLSELQNLGTKRKLFGDAEAKREKADYKRFFNVVNKHVVFYSESSGFYKYYKGIIEYLIAHTNLVIHYITSDPNDAIFQLSEKQPRIRAYYIGEKRLITLMMKMEADIVIMTMPDLENFHIKRSYVRKDIEYIYIPHGMDSLNMTMRTGSMDHYDTVFCVGPSQKEEIEKTEIAYGLSKKTLVEWGYCLLDEMRADYAKLEKPENAIKKILIAPSWQPDNIVDSCLEQLLDGLKGRGWQVTVRPHPQHVRHRKEQMELLKEKFAENKDIEIQTDFSSNSTVLEADLLITDWSGIAFEYAYTTGKPVLFVDTPMKVMNPEYQKIDTKPINIWIRTKIGRIVGLNEMDQVGNIVSEMLKEKDKYKETIESFVRENVYNLGHSSEVGAKYIVQQLQKKQKKKGE